MWMIRLLPGMGPAAEAPPTKQTAGKTMIKLKPTAVLPPANINAKHIVSQFKEEVYAFHRCSGGRVDQIHALFCQIAENNGKPPIPPQTMAALLELTMEEMREQPCIVSDVALCKAFEKMVKPDDTGENFETKVISVVRLQTARFSHAAVEIEKLRPAFEELHVGCKGSAQALFTFFMDLLPEDQRGQYSLPMWNVMVMKCPQTTTHIPLDHFVRCFQESMDTSDNAETIMPVLKKHIELLKDPQAAAAAAKKVPSGPPPPSETAIALVAKFEESIKSFHSSCGGRVSQIHALFCEICHKNGKPPVPPQAMSAMLELSQEELRVQPCVAAPQQLIKAFQKMVKPDETEENFKEKVVKVVEDMTTRCTHAQSEIQTLRPALTKLHEACGGASKVLYEFFSDLVPEEQRSQFTIEVFCAMVMRVHPKSAQIPIDHFILSFQDSMDISDNASKILPVLEKHIDKFTQSSVAVVEKPEADEEGEKDAA